MAASNEPGVIRPVVESAAGQQSILHGGLRSELLSDSTIASRVRLDCATSGVAQALSPTPTSGRPVQGLVQRDIQANGYLIIQVKPDATDGIDSDDALAKCNVSVVVRDHTVPMGQPGDYFVKQLTIADRDTDRVADDGTLTAGAWNDAYAFKVPSGQSWLMHGEHEIFIADDTA